MVMWISMRLVQSMIFGKKDLAANQGKATTSAESLADRDNLTQLVAGIVVHGDRLIISLKSDGADDASDSSDVRSLTIPWQKPPPESPAGSCFRIMHRE